MPLGYEVFAGNRVDVTTVEEIVTTMERRYGAASRIWVMDRGMCSADNIAWLQRGGRRYLLGASRPELKRFAPALTDVGSAQRRVGSAAGRRAGVVPHMDKKTGAPKRGAQGSGSTAGGVGRLVRVLQQLDLTFDSYGMSGKQIVELLPDEFDAWRR